MTSVWSTNFSETKNYLEAREVDTVTKLREHSNIPSDKKHQLEDRSPDISPDIELRDGKFTKKDL